MNSLDGLLHQPSMWWSWHVTLVCDLGTLLRPPRAMQWLEVSARELVRNMLRLKEVDKKVACSPSILTKILTKSARAVSHTKDDGNLQQPRG